MDANQMRFPKVVPRNVSGSKRWVTLRATARSAVGFPHPCSGLKKPRGPEEVRGDSSPGHLGRLVRRQPPNSADALRTICQTP